MQSEARCIINIIYISFKLCIVKPIRQEITFNLKYHESLLITLSMSSLFSRCFITVKLVIIVFFCLPLKCKLGVRNIFLAG